MDAAGATKPAATSDPNMVKIETGMADLFIHKDTFEVLKKGTHVKKTSTWKSKVMSKIKSDKSRTLHVSEDGTKLVWGSHKATEGVKHLALMSIHRVVLDKNEKTMVVDAGTGQKKTFTFNNDADFESFGKAFEKLVIDFLEMARANALESRLHGLWTRADKDGDGFITYDEYKVFLEDVLHIDLTTNTMNQIMKEHDVSKDGKLDYKEFVQGIRKFQKNIGFVTALFRNYGGVDGVMLESDLADFLMMEQGMKDRLEAEAEARKAIHEFSMTTVPAEPKRGLTMHGFFAYLLSINNNAMDPVDKSVHMDMSQPLSHYYINSSHNTYLDGNQLTGTASTQAYERAIRAGARCVELDIWDGENDQPILTHGHTLTGAVLLADALDVIKKFAFEYSHYPFILSVENHCSAKQQSVMAQLFASKLGKDIVPYKQHSGPKAQLPSPKELMNKFIIKCKVKDETPPELAKLVFLRGAKFKDWNNSLALDVNDMHSFSESKLESLIDKVPEIPSPGSDKATPAGVDIDGDVDSLAFNVEGGARKLLEYNARHLSRVYPKGTRVGSDNYDPSLAWDYGCQVVALNFQTVNPAILSNHAMFCQNNNAGYVLQPDYIRGLKDAKPKKSVVVTVQVVMGYNLPSYGSDASRKQDIMNPYVIVECGTHRKKPEGVLGPGPVSMAAGIAADNISSHVHEMRTKTVKQNDFDPVFLSDDPKYNDFQVYVENRDTGSIHFRIMNEIIGKDGIIAYGAVMVRSLRPGYRFVTFLDNLGKPLRAMHGLLCHFKFSE